MKTKQKIDIIKNTIFDSQYMTKRELDKFLKDNNYLDKSNNNEDMYKLIFSKLESEFDSVILKLQEYEYDKKYRYFTLYKYDDTGIDIEKNIKCLKANKKVNSEVVDCWEAREIPTIKEYEKDLDIKFTLLLKSKYDDKIIKYNIIATIFKDEKIISIKWSSVQEEFYNKELYINNNNKVKSWIELNLGIILHEFESKKGFRKLYDDIKDNPDKHPNESHYRVLMDDDMNGRSSFIATDKGILPFVGQLTQIAENFENMNDKKILLDYISEYEKNSIMRVIGIKWKNNFSNSGRKLGEIIVSISSEYSGNNENNTLKYEYTLHHIMQKAGINRERINYVIRFLSKYSR